LGLPIGANGWLGRVDTDLKSEPTLQGKAISVRVDSLSLQWVDVYVQEVKASLALMESDARFYDELNYRLVTQALDSYSQDEAIRIHDEEIKSGWYTVGRELAQFEKSAADAAASGAQEIDRIFRDLFMDPEVTEAWSNPLDTAGRRAAAAFVLANSPYQKVHDESVTGGFVSWSKGINETGIPTMVVAGGVAVDPAPTPVVVWYATYKSALTELAWYAANARAAAAYAKANSLASTFASGAKGLAEKWATADAGFRRQRTDAQLQARELRRQALEQPAAATNLAERCATVRIRFVEQLAEVLAKAVLISTTMSHRFGVKWSKLPPMPDTWIDGSDSYLAALQRWCVELDNALSRAQRTETSKILAVSVAQTAPAPFAAAIAALRSGAATSLQVEFFIEDTMVRELRGVRVRGVMLSVLDTRAADADSWTGKITAPKSAISCDSAGARHQFIQILKPVDAGRIFNRSSTRAPDLIGISELRNASPFGDLGSVTTADRSWRMEISGKSLLGASATNLTDVIVEVVVSGVSA
jgi:hypothetical protein